MTTETEYDFEYIGEIFLVVTQLVEGLEWAKRGYLPLVDGGDQQDVGQFHFHLGKLTGD